MSRTLAGVLSSANSSGSRPSNRSATPRKRARGVPTSEMSRPYCRRIWRTWVRRRFSTKWLLPESGNRSRRRHSGWSSPASSRRGRLSPSRVSTVTRSNENPAARMRSQSRRGSGSVTGTVRTSATSSMASQKTMASMMMTTSPYVRNISEPVSAVRTGRTNALTSASDRPKRRMSMISPWPISKVTASRVPTGSPRSRMLAITLKSTIVRIRVTALKSVRTTSGRSHGQCLLLRDPAPASSVMWRVCRQRRSPSSPIGHGVRERQAARGLR